jgi:hypothetical protein
MVVDRPAKGRPLIVNVVVLGNVHRLQNVVRQTGWPRCSYDCHDPMAVLERQEAETGMHRLPTGTDSAARGRSSLAGTSTVAR